MRRLEDVAALACDLIASDTRAERSNIPAVERCAEALGGFEIETTDYTDEHGVHKRVLAARRGEGPCVALCGHLDTVGADGWTTDPWKPRIADGVLHGLGASDMKGPVAALLVAAASVAADVPVMVLLTADEETTRAGVNVLVERSRLLRQSDVRAIVVGEPTGMVPVRGHRASVNFTATATGVQAHSATGLGTNANWALLEFLHEISTLRQQLLTDPTLQDPAYEPAASDLNLVIENPPVFVSMTVPQATARLKYRYSAGIDPMRVAGVVRAQARRAKIQLEEWWEGPPAELPASHWLVAAAEEVSGREARTQPYGTDASSLQSVAPCLVMGPGDIAVAHRPSESVRVAELESAVPIYAALATRLGRGWAATPCL